MQSCLLDDLLSGFNTNLKNIKTCVISKLFGYADFLDKKCCSMIKQPRASEWMMEQLTDEDTARSVETGKNSRRLGCANRASVNAQDSTLAMSTSHIGTTSN